MRSCEICRALNVEPLLFTIEKSTLCRPYCMSRMPHERLARQVLAKPTRKQTRGCLRTSGSDYISDLAWSCVGVEPAEYLKLLLTVRNFESSWGCCPHDTPYSSGFQPFSCSDQFCNTNNPLLKIFSRLMQCSCVCTIEKHSD